MQLFCKYKLSNYHDEGEFATSLLNGKEVMGKPIDKVKQKLLSSQLEVNANTSSCDSKAREKIETKCRDEFE